MHELPIVESMLSIALESAEQANARRITIIEVVIGELSSFVDDSIQFYFDIISKGTLAEGAVLRFHREPAIARCLACGHEADVRPPLPPAMTICPACGSEQVRVNGGDACRLASIEVDDEDEGDEQMNR